MKLMNVGQAPVVSSHAAVSKAAAPSAPKAAVAATPAHAGKQLNCKG